MKPYLPDESNVGAWAWLVLLVGVNVYWIGFDLWARHANHEFMTTELREGINNPVLGPLVLGLIAFTVTAFLTHMFSVTAKL